MTRLVERLPLSIQAFRAVPLRALTGLAVGMVAVAVYATCLRLERLIFGLGLDDTQVKAGVVLPAAAFDGHSYGTLSIVGEGLSNPLAQAVSSTASYAKTLRAVVLPHYWAELLNALVVLALAAVVLLLCIRLLRGGPFVARTTASLAIFAALLAAGSIASQLVRRGPIGGDTPSVAATREGGVWAIMLGQHPELGSYYEVSPYSPGGEPGLDLFPLGIAVLIAVIAAAFWLGHRMQRDTQGLV